MFIDIITEAEIAFSLTPEIVSELEEVRHECRLDNGGGGACHLVSEYIEDKWGFERIDGTYLDDQGRPITDGHMWNVLPDGTILDATADQLGEGSAIVLLSPDDPDFTRYHPYLYTGKSEEEQDATDAIQAHHHKDALRLRKELGDGWWLKDKSALKAYRKMQIDKYEHHVPEYPDRD